MAAVPCARQVVVLVGECVAMHLSSRHDLPGAPCPRDPCPCGVLGLTPPTPLHAQQLQGRVVGDPSHADTFFGPLSSHMHRDKVGRSPCTSPCTPTTYRVPAVAYGSGSQAVVDGCVQVESYVKLAVEEGGTIACGGKRPDLPAPFCNGAFFEPTVVTVSAAGAAAAAVACCGSMAWRGRREQGRIARRMSGLLRMPPRKPTRACYSYGRRLV